MKTVAFCSLALGLAPFSHAQVFVDTFEGGVNVGQWRIGGPGEFIDPTGGNPGAHLRSDGLDVAIVATISDDGVSSPFTGNYAARGISALSIDAITRSVQFGAGGRPMTLMLANNNGTPGVFDDDIYIYYVGSENIPVPGQGWKTFNFSVPSSATTLPPGWQVLLDFNAPPLTNDQAWNLVIQDVSYVWFNWHDPEFFAIFQMWDVGVDNISISEPAACYANCDNSTGQPILNVADFTCFLTKFAAGDPYANCDGSTQVPTLNIADFTCFLAKFAAGCN
jgi:hypothetical protein